MKDYKQLEKDHEKYSQKIKLEESRLEALMSDLEPILRVEIARTEFHIPGESTECVDTRIEINESSSLLDDYEDCKNQIYNDLVGLTQVRVIHGILRTSEPMLKIVPFDEFEGIYLEMKESRVFNNTYLVANPSSIVKEEDVERIARIKAADYEKSGFLTRFIKRVIRKNI